jgi:hypothetical protein
MFFFSRHFFSPHFRSMLPGPTAARTDLVPVFPHHFAKNSRPVYTGFQEAFFSEGDPPELTSEF